MNAHPFKTGSRLSLLGAVLVALSQSLAATESVECGSNSTTHTFTKHCHEACCYDTEYEAEFQAAMALRDEMVASAGVACLSSGCTPDSCLAQIQQMAAGQYSVTNTQNPITHKWSSTACWNGGPFQVHCTSCTPQ